MDDRKLVWAAVSLLRGGVAPRHVRRCMEELRTHRADLFAQLRAQGHDADGAAAEADARLGTCEDFVAAMLARPELQGWASRAPWLVFAVLPVIAFILLGVAVIVLVVACVELMSPAAKTAADPAMWRLGSTVLVATIHWALPLAVGGVVLAVAWRGRVRPVWPAFGLLLVAALAAVVTLQLVGPQTGRQGQLSVGAGYPPRDLFRTVLLLGAAVGGIAMVWLRERAGPTPGRPE